MVIFNSYVKLPEGKLTKRCGKPTVSRSMKHDLQIAKIISQNHRTQPGIFQAMEVDELLPAVLNRGVKHQEHGSTLVEG